MLSASDEEAIDSLQLCRWVAAGIGSRPEVLDVVNRYSPPTAWRLPRIWLISVFYASSVVNCLRCGLCEMSKPQQRMSTRRLVELDPIARNTTIQ
jgi:hypothetical protein